MVLSNKVYPIAKFITQIGLPALGTLYFALAAIWNLPAPEKVLGSIIAVDTFLGVLLGISTNTYTKSGAQYSGSLNVTDTPEKTVYSLDLNHEPEELKNKSQVTFKVNQNPASSR